MGIGSFKRSCTGKGRFLQGCACKGGFLRGCAGNGWVVCVQAALSRVVWGKAGL